jgi:hypothetical protein
MSFNHGRSQILNSQSQSKSLSTPPIAWWDYVGWSSRPTFASRSRKWREVCLLDPMTRSCGVRDEVRPRKPQKENWWGGGGSGGCYTVEDSAAVHHVLHDVKELIRDAAVLNNAARSEFCVCLSASLGMPRASVGEKPHSHEEKNRRRGKHPERDCGANDRVKVSSSFIFSYHLHPNQFADPSSLIPQLESIDHSSHLPDPLTRRQPLRRPMYNIPRLWVKLDNFKYEISIARRWDERSKGYVFLFTRRLRRSIRY